MTGNFIDDIRYYFKKPPENCRNGTFFLDTDYGRIRAFDTKGNKPVIINVPDGPNVIEHQLDLLQGLSNFFRVVCFEYPGLGFSYPNFNYDYSFKNGSDLLLQVMDILGIRKGTLLFSCSNGFYAIKAAGIAPDRFEHIFLSQTPSIHAMVEWTQSSIPGILKVPLVGQIANSFMSKKLAHVWYKYALPKNTELGPYRQKALSSISNGGCFCLSGLVQGLMKDTKRKLEVSKVPTTLVWGEKDFTHRNTDKQSVIDHVESCEIIEFQNCGHFPELEDTDRYIQLIRERLV